jgi:hypothetical protein
MVGNAFSASIVWDDNVNDAAEILYVGSEVETGAKVEVWYAQKPFPDVQGGMATSTLRIVSGSDEIIYQADEDGENWGTWSAWTNGAGAEIALDSASHHMLAVPASPLLPGPDNGAYHVTVVAKQHGSFRYLDWTCTPRSTCNIPHIYGGLGAVFQRLTQWQSALGLAGLGAAASGPDADGWSIILGSLGMGRDSLKAPYSGQKWSMRPGTWGMVCNNLVALPQLARAWEWDPLPTELPPEPPT